MFAGGSLMIDTCWRVGFTSDTNIAMVGVLQCGAVWCSVVQCGAVWCCVVQCGACVAVWCRMFDD